MALTDEQLEILSETLTPLFQYLEKEVIADVARRINKTLTYSRTAELQAMSMRELGYSPAKIRKEAMKLLSSDKEFRKAVAKNTLEYKREIRKLINDITKEAYKANNDIVASAGNMSWIDDLSVWKKAGKNLGDNSFLKQLVDSFSAQTEGALKNMMQSTGFKTMNGFEAVESLYKRELDKAAIKICSGTFSVDKVVSDTVHSLAQSGLRTIDFSSGYSMQLDTAARLALRTGCHQLAAKVMDKNMEQSGENLVYVSKHWGARNTGVGHANHEQWQGKVYFIKDGTNYSEEAKRIGQDHITNLWYATGYSADGEQINDPLGLNGYNCRHHHYVWFEGVSELPKESPEPKPVTINGKTYDYYSATQKMRSMERDIRALKREKEALGKLGMDTKEIQAKIRRKTSEYHQFCRDAGISAKDNRLRYEVGTTDIKKTEAWKKYQSTIVPEKKIFSNIRYMRKNIEYSKMALDINKELDKICINRSKWSSKIIVDKDINAIGQKEWNCDITLVPSADYSDLLHELIHARSSSYYNAEVYVQFKKIEEGSVELLTEEICKRKGIGYIETYREQVESLRKINRRARLYKNEILFARDLINVPLPDRLEWLIKKINENYASGTITDKELNGLWEAFTNLAEENI